MQLLIVNIILALNLTYFVGQSAPWDLNKPLVFLLVFAFSFIAIYLPSYFYSPRYFYKIPVLIKFCGFITKEVLESNIRVAKDVLTPKPLMHPAIIKLPLKLQKDRDVISLGLLITFTPGTLCLYVDKRERKSGDKSREVTDEIIGREKPGSKFKYTMYIHEMYIPNPGHGQDMNYYVDKEKESLRKGYEKKIKALSE